MFFCSVNFFTVSRTDSSSLTGILFRVLYWSSSQNLLSNWTPDPFSSLSLPIMSILYSSFAKSADFKADYSSLSDTIVLMASAKDYFIFISKVL